MATLAACDVRVVALRAVADAAALETYVGQVLLCFRRNLTHAPRLDSGAGRSARRLQLLLTQARARMTVAIHEFFSP